MKKEKSLFSDSEYQTRGSAESSIKRIQRFSTNRTGGI